MMEYSDQTAVMCSESDCGNVFSGCTCPTIRYLISYKDLDRRHKGKEKYLLPREALKLFL